ncbi:MAG TPA: flippase-like domain-containing protein [Gammaproteobacteria bacterium]|nr:flippase-like domain-containing protein [Gammaproteobacteria bacterium]
MTDLRPATASQQRQHWGSALRLLVTLLILWLIFRTINMDSVLNVIKQVNIPLLGLAVLFQLLSTLLAGYRWYLVMHQLRFGNHAGFYIRSYFKGSFFNQGLPTSIGGDAIRVVDVAATGFRKRDAFKGVFIDRILGLLGLLLLNLFANALQPDLLPKQLFYILNLLVLGGVAGFVLLIFIHRLRWLNRWRISRFLLSISSQLQDVMRGLRNTSRQMGLSIVIHILSMINIFLIGRSVGLSYDIVTFTIIVPPVILLTLVPISLAGWGVREGAMIGLFTLIGADQSIVLSMSILYGIILVVASLPGLYVYLYGKHHHV